MFPKHSIERRLLDYLAPQWRILLVGSICAFGMSTSALALAWVAENTLHALISHSKSLLLEICLVLVAVYVARWFLSFGQTVLFSEAGQRIAQRMRVSIYEHLQYLSLSYFDKQRTGNLISTFNNDVPIVQNGIMSLKDMIAGPVLIVGGFIWICIISIKLTAICLLILPLMGIAISAISRRLRAISLDTQNALGDVTTVMEETLAGARLVRAFSAEQREISRFGRGVQIAKDITMKGIRRAALLSPTTDLLGALGMAIALWIGGNEVFHGHITAEGLAKFVVCVDRIRLGVGNVGNIGVTWKQTLGAAERIFGGVLDVPVEVVDRPNAKRLDLSSGEVQFHSVGFGYRKDQVVLDNVSFTMRPGQVTAIVGPSGAGKSTMADLIPRFYDATFGCITIDEQDIRDVTVTSLRQHIGIVPQETIIFGGAVRENIAYGSPESSLDEIMAAAKAANAHEFITQLQNGYDTIVGERGVMLSGGQRQRIAIARALLKNPRILILDEATSSLDETSQILVQEALEKLMRGRTTLVIAHRLSTIKNADLIVVLHAGQIVESGSHTELLRRGGAYARLYETQFRQSDDDDDDDDGRTPSAGIAA